jgi:hypothetical protein
MVLDIAMSDGWIPYLLVFVVDELIDYSCISYCLLFKSLADRSMHSLSWSSLTATYIYEGVLFRRNFRMNRGDEQKNVLLRSFCRGTELHY